MTGFKRSKQSRARGSWTHGWGSKKKHRGAGHRGGRGRAGSGKKGDAKKPMYWKEKGFYENKGFSSKSRTKITTVNIGELCKNIDYFVTHEMAKQAGDAFVMNLSDLGCDKILGSGRVDKKLQVTVSIITERAKTKIEKAGGTVTVATVAEKKTEAKPKAKPQEKVAAEE